MALRPVCGDYAPVRIATKDGHHVAMADLFVFRRGGRKWGSAVLRRVTPAIAEGDYAIVPVDSGHRWLASLSREGSNSGDMTARSRVAPPWLG